MIIKDGTNDKIAKFKLKLGLVGDVYVVNNHIASLYSHKKAYPQSIATIIEEAEQEFIKYQNEELQSVATEVNDNGESIS